ncbi:MAG: ribonuclease H-like domain-containing protein [bacterium]
MGEVVLDIETQNSFQEVGEYNPSLLKISLIGVYFYDTDTYESFLEPDLLKLWPRLEKADRIIGYNILGFDFPVMAKYYAGDLLRIPSLDIMKELERELGFRVKLDSVAEATLGHGKSGNGLQAIDWWKKGEIDKIREYCLMDVKVTRECYEFGKKNKFLEVADKNGGKLTVKTEKFDLPTATSKPKINLTMPF